MKLNKIISALLSSCLLAGCAAPFNTTKENKTVGIIQLVDHPSLNTIRDAIEEELEKENITIEYQNAAGKISNLDTIVNTFVNNKVDVLVPITTPAAQVARNYEEKIPVVFAAVSDPVAAGLIDENNPLNITGTSDVIPVESIIDLMLELTPDTKTVGILYNSAEVNSVSNCKRFKEYAKEKGLTIIEKTGTDLVTLQQAMSLLVEQCDAIFSPNDNTVASGMVSLAETAVNAKVPYYVGADSMIEDGGFATIGIDYTVLGKETANLILEVLNGKKVSEIPIVYFDSDLEVLINKDVAEKLNIDISEYN